MIIINYYHHMYMNARIIYMYAYYEPKLFLDANVSRPFNYYFVNAIFFIF